jgi:hypothetical protein
VGIAGNLTRYITPIFVGDAHRLPKPVGKGRFLKKINCLT